MQLARRGCYVDKMIVFLALQLISFPGVSSFVLPGRFMQTTRRYPTSLVDDNTFVSGRTRTANMLAIDSTNKGEHGMYHTWSPQDLTKDLPGYFPIPDDDYVKKYQNNPELWPVEFFLITYRRTNNKETKKRETQILVRPSANGTSKWGLGTGVPATRWMLSMKESRPPLGYKWSEPRTSFEASNFPEFPKNGQKSWTYDKIDMREDAFSGPDVATEFKDPELEEYANKIREELRSKLSVMNDDSGENLSSWDSSRISVVKDVVDSANSLAAIQGTLRMSGLFARIESFANQQQNGITVGLPYEGSPFPRYVSLGKNAPDSAKLVQSMRIFTMFPQMPDPMPLPSTPPEELQKEITSRGSRMAESGRDPHNDEYGRKFTHISTSNVSNTIIGIYLTLDVTAMSGLDKVPAVDLFGTKNIAREWISLEDLKVLDSEGKRICTEDSKPTFISGFIVRQLVKDGVIDIHG